MPSSDFPRISEAPAGRSGERGTVTLRVLIIVSGGIAAYKVPELIRRLGDRGIRSRCILTRAGAEFVTPLTLGAVSGDTVFDALFSLTDESDMGHIQLSRDADLVLVVPATANILAKMVQGIADDLATTALLATDKPVMVAPAMNVKMWENDATQANMAALRARGVRVIGPERGAMACNEEGEGRMADPDIIVEHVAAYLANAGRLAGRRALVTSGPTHEAIDPVRYIANRSSGKQGHAIAEALARFGAETTLITGPVHCPDPSGVHVVHVESARDMLAATQDALPADIAVCAAAVADWRPADAALQKLKKTGGAAPNLAFVENPDILATLSEASNRRPALVVGFAAETENVTENARTKRARKGCDWILANDVSPATGTFGGDANTVHFVTAAGAEDWPTASKTEVAHRLAERIATHFEHGASDA